METDAPFTDEQRKTAETVAKLLQLGKKNPNAEEAASAVSKAMDLALKWNLDVEAIGAQGDEGSRLKDRIKGGWYEWHVDIWHYVAEHGVPYNPLHDRFYPSIGCAPCTRAVAVGEDQRAGRWWWELDGAKECGLHPEGRHVEGAKA